MMTERDVENLRRIFSDPVAMRSVDDERRGNNGLDPSTRDNFDTYGVGFWVVEEKATGRCLGQCGIIAQELGRTRHMEVAYLFVRRAWGHGYATEAALA